MLIGDAASGVLGLVRRAREDLLSKGHRTLYKNLDGIRAMAALLVLLTHAQLSSRSLGGTGVWLFFVLSGFLLFPTLPREVDGLFLRRMAGFLVKRVTRLVPLYYVAVLVYAQRWHFGQVWLAKHLLFLDAKSFFWTVKLEVIFYLLLPVIGILTCMIKPRWQKFLVLAIATAAYHFFVQVPALVTVTAAVTEVPLWLSPFMLGICASIIAPSIPRGAGYSLLIVGLLGLALLNLDLPGAVHLREMMLTAGHVDNVAFHYTGLTALMATFVIAGAAVIPPNSVFCNPIIRTAGVCGYSFYIWQILVMQILSSIFGKLDPLPTFLMAAVATFFVSIFSFALIELPAMTWGHALARRLVEGGADRQLKQAV